ncbi:MAG: dihydroorotate dehydrogenase electron transfer subunit [Bacilli bacterium]|nr:dihydroorotate dehydrogenase electron transfer subunit [Bacilli bacterium]
MKLVESMHVIKNECITKDIYKMIISGNNVKLMSKPGQFVTIKIDNNDSLILRRPISICEIDQENNCFTIIYRVVGKGTELLTNKKVGDNIDILGPLGNGFNIDNINKNKITVIVGGGIGIPPLYELAKRLKEQNIRIIIILGFNSYADIFYEKEFKQLSETYISTIDGSYGYKGNALDLIDKKNINFDYIYACGPKGMLKAIDDKYRTTKKGYLSLEEKMACGIGACTGCVCKIRGKNEYKRVCKDGPIFALGEIEL